MRNKQRFKKIAANMNANRLVHLAGSVSEEIKRKPNLIVSLDELINATEAAISSPGEANHRKATDLADSLTTRLMESPINSLSPVIWNDLATLNIDGQSATALLGKPFARSIQTAFETGPNVRALDQLRSARKQIDALMTAADSISAAAKSLGIGPEKLERGSSVFGVTMPRAEVNDARTLQQELRWLSQLIGSVDEGVTGGHKPIPILTLRSSDLGIDFGVSVDVASALAMLVTLGRAGISKWNEIRDAKTQMTRLNLSAPAEALDKEIQKAVDQTIEDIVIEATSRVTLEDAGRRSEIENSIRIHVPGLLARLERGYVFEVRVHPEDHSADDPRLGSIRDLSTMAVTLSPGAPLLQIPGRAEPEEEQGQESKETREKRRRPKKN